MPGSKDRSWRHNGHASTLTSTGAVRKQQGKAGNSSDLSLADEMAKHVYSLDDCEVSISWTLEPGRKSQFYICLHRKLSKNENEKTKIAKHLIPEKYRSGEECEEIQRRSVPFLTSPRQWPDTVNGEKLRALHNSHLCHNGLCYSILHICQEAGPRNHGRNGCPGTPLCRHYPRCLVPGSHAYS